MLLSFGVQNFKAFRDVQELSLRRAGQDRRDPRPDEWDAEVNALTAVYGANASGKSSLVQALDHLVDAVENSYVRWLPGAGTGAEPFALDPTTAAQPSSFEIEIRAGDGLDYQYGFAVDDRRVVREWLYVYRTAHRTVLFVRDQAEVTFGPAFRGARVALAEAADTRPNALTLSVGVQLGNRVLAPVYRAILSVRVYQAGAVELGAMEAAHLLAEQPEQKAWFLELLRNADLGVSDVAVRETPAAEQDELRADLTRFGLPSAVVERQVRLRSWQLLLTHTGAYGDVELPFDAESDGTQALVAFGPVALEGLSEGHTVVIDEIDTSLHPLVVRAVVGLFADPVTNPRQAQLVFTTHDTSLLGRTADGPAPLSRDQFWRTEKDPATGAAELVAVAEYSPRKSENLERGYLTGRYGGVPRVSFPLVRVDR